LAASESHQTSLISNTMKETQYIRRFLLLSAIATCIVVVNGASVAATVSGVEAKQDKLMEKPAYSEIHEKNIFDPKRQPWVEKVESPPPPDVPPLTAADAEVYGVMAFGDFKKAIIKLGAGFKYAPQPKNKSAPRPFVILGIGESLGPYTIKEITDKSVVFENSGAEFPLAFNHKKSDRPASGPISPMAQAPVILPVPVPTIVQGLEPIVTAAAQPQAVPQPEAQVQQAAQPTSGQAPAAQAAAAAAAAQQPAAAESAAPQQPAIQGRTLLEAIELARQAQQANPGAAPPPNPFVKR
jgi:hypothetical protein